MMHWTQIIGILLLALPFAGMFVGAAISHGLWFAVSIFSATGILVAIILAGVHLATGGAA